MDSQTIFMPYFGRFPFLTILLTYAHEGAHKYQDLNDQGGDNHSSMSIRWNKAFPRVSQPKDGSIPPGFVSNYASCSTPITDFPDSHLKAKEIYRINQKGLETLILTSLRFHQPFEMHSILLSAREDLSPILNYLITSTTIMEIKYPGYLMKYPPSKEYISTREDVAETVTAAHELFLSHPSYEGRHNYPVIGDKILLSIFLKDGTVREKIAFVCEEGLIDDPIATAVLDKSWLKEELRKNERTN